MKKSNKMKANAEYAESFCRACLSTERKLYSASEDISSIYRSFVSQVYSDKCLHFCTYCAYFLQKTMIFLQRCREANQLLNSLEIQEDVNLKSCCNLKITTLEPINIHPSGQEFGCVLKEDTVFKIEKQLHEDSSCNLLDDERPRGDEFDDMQVNKIEEQLLIGGSRFDNEAAEDSDNNAAGLPTDTDDETDSKPLSLRVAALVDAMDTAEGLANAEEEHGHRTEGPRTHDDSSTTDYVDRGAIHSDVADTTETAPVSGKHRTADVAADYPQIDMTAVAHPAADTCDAAYAQSGKSKCHRRNHTKDKSHISKKKLTKKSKKKNCSSNAKRIYECDTCHEKFQNSSRLKSHSSIHIGEKSYACDVCNSTFFKSTSLSAHKRTHIKEKTHTCETCGAKFVGSEGLELHLRMHTGKDIFICDKCGSIFARRGAIQSHLRVHTGERPYACDTCDSKFATSSMLRIHTRIHTGEKPYSCDTCNKKFTTTGDLKSHLRVHTGEKPYVCDSCGAKFTYASGFRDHMKTHTSEKSYACRTCNRKFALSRSLERHNRTHNADRLHFVCDTCGKKLISRLGLIYHIRTHTGEKPFTCVCGKKFSALSSLNTHKKNAHTGEKSGKKSWTCDVCDAKCTSKHSLKSHLRIHSGEKPYACETCGARFARSDYLKFHVRLHTGEKPFACDICQERFLRADYLKRHLRSHSKGKPDGRRKSSKVTTRRSILTE